MVPQMKVLIKEVFLQEIQANIDRIVVEIKRFKKEGASRLLRFWLGDISSEKLIKTFEKR